MELSRFRDLDLRMRRLRTQVGEDGIVWFVPIASVLLSSICSRRRNHSGFHRLSYTAGPLSRPPASERDGKTVQLPPFSEGAAWNNPRFSFFSLRTNISLVNYLNTPLSRMGLPLRMRKAGKKQFECLTLEADYRALVTDVNLAPGKLTGWDVAKRGRGINADLPVVYMTGSEAARMGLQRSAQ